MIFYFSGTGNSRYVASRISAFLKEPVTSLNGEIKSGNLSFICNDSRLVFILPTYAWRIPRVAEKWIRAASFSAEAKAWFVMDCGSEIGGADKYLRRLCQDKSLDFKGVFPVIMPENYIALFNAPDKAEAEKIIEKANPAIDTAAKLISRSEAFPAPRRNLYDRAVSALMNPVFYRFIVKADPFYATNACVSCGKCVALCPLNNISLQNGKPVWGDSCTHCMACICHCPAEAIEYGKKALGKPRYHID